MSLKNHPFFKALEMQDKIYKNGGPFTMNDSNNRAGRRIFYGALEEAHPFIFDRAVSREKRFIGRALPDSKDIGEMAKEFSPPFGSCLYLLSSNDITMTPIGDEIFPLVCLGYLLYETDPENYLLYEVHTIERRGETLPIINLTPVTLAVIQKLIDAREAQCDDRFNETINAHILKEVSVVYNLTKAISVKRIGVEKAQSFTTKTRGMGTAGFTKLKYDNLIHIADKEEYEFVKPQFDGSIDWEWSGFWRGHWRAFYVQDLKDSFGRNVVDYNRIGKDRSGFYNVAGYTWVKEHTKGNKEAAEIKIRTVKKEE